MVKSWQSTAHCIVELFYRAEQKSFKHYSEKFMRCFSILCAKKLIVA